MHLIISNGGKVRCLYGEAIELASIGPMQITRASHVEPDDHGQWWADMSPVHGPKLGPFDLRSEALEAEREWMEDRELQKG